MPPFSFMYANHSLEDSEVSISIDWGAKFYQPFDLEVYISRGATLNILLMKKPMKKLGHGKHAGYSHGFSNLHLALETIIDI